MPATDESKLEPDPPGGFKMSAAPDESKTDQSKTGSFEPRAFDPGGSTKEAVIDSTDFHNACAPLRVSLGSTAWRRPGATQHIWRTGDVRAARERGTRA